VGLEAGFQAQVMRVAEVPKAAGPAEEAEKEKLVG
jgi:hypothetical protein